MLDDWEMECEDVYKHDDVACKAMFDYIRNTIWTYNYVTKRGIRMSKVNIERFAEKHGVSVEAMWKHEDCVKAIVGNVFPK